MAKKVTTTTTPLLQSDTEIPIIWLSDDENDETTITTTVVALPKAGKKRHSTNENGEKRLRSRRKIKAAGAPKMPLTGYVRFMNYRREYLRKEYPSKSANDHTKMIGEEWNQLKDDQKAPYMQAAEIDKKRYTTELDIFLKENPDILASEIAKNKARKSNGGTDRAVAGKGVLKDKSQQLNRDAAGRYTKNFIEEPKIIYISENNNSDEDYNPLPTKRKRTKKSKSNSNSSSSNNSSSNNNSNNNKKNDKATIVKNTVTTSALVPGSIPIFSLDFLDHNKISDMNLRKLRKTKFDLEQRNSLLENHVEDLKSGVDQLVTENDELEEKTRLLEIYVDKLKQKLVNALSTIPIPIESSGPTMENIDKYLDGLYEMATLNTPRTAGFNKAKEIISNLDFEIQL